MPEPRKPFQRRTWVRRAIPIGVVAVLVGAGTTVVRTNASATTLDTYRTTSVTTGSVVQRLNLTGSVQRVNQVTESFAMDGTVSSVLVSVGDTVKAGQPLATIDPIPLRSAVTDAQASLAQAKATLESDQSAATAAAAATAATAAAAAAPSPTPRASSPTPRSGPGTGSGQSLAGAQKLVTSAQRAVTTDVERTSTALTLCAPFFPSGTPAPATTDTTPTTGPTPPGTTATPSADEIAACLGALSTAPTQQQIQRDQQALNSAQANLAKAVTSAITAAGTTAQSSGSTSRSATSQSATSQSTSTRTGATSQSSADRVVSDQAAVTSAEASLTSAASDLAASTLKASIAGTVGSVSLVKNASSNGNNVVIVGPGAVEVTVNVPLASMPNVHVGQKANVTPQGATNGVPGAVTSISLLPSTSTSTSSTASASTSSAGSASRTATGTGQATAATSSPTYPVVVLVPDALAALASGARAEVSLLIGTATNVLTVPNSALTPLGNGQALAMTFKNGVATRAVVKIGYAGTLTTQVASGLTAGQQVVLADLSTALPTNTTNARRFGVGGAAGGLGGAGFGGATGGFGGATGGLGGATGGLGGATGGGRGGFTPGG